MNCRATFAGLRMLLLGTASQAPAEPCQPTSEAVSGPVTSADQPQKPDGLALLNQRAWLIHRARQEKPRSEAKARLISQAYSVTHDILRRGPDATTE